MTARGSRGGGRGEPVGDYQPPGGMLFNLSSGGVGRVQGRARAGAIAPFIGAGGHQPMPEPNITPITRSPADTVFLGHGRTRPRARGGGISREGLLVFCNISGIWTGRGPPPQQLLGLSQYGAPPPAQAPVQQPVQQAPPPEPVQVQPAPVPLSQVGSGASGSAQPTSTAPELAICARKIAQALNEFAETLEKK